MTARTTLFIHGLFVTYRSWDQWVARFQANGYPASALPWPGRDKPVAELRRAHPDPALGRLTLDEAVAHFDTAARGMSEPPILIGHSLGGLIVQILLNRGLGAAGVAIDSAPPRGLLSLEWSFLKSNWPMLNPLASSSTPYYMSFAEWQYAFVNGLPLAEQQAAYEQQCVPESRRAGRGALGAVARVDYKKPHAPLLMLAGSTDHIVPASLNRANVAKYKASSSPVDFKEFPGRTHFGIGQQGWEEMADYVLAWLGKRDE